MCSFPDCEVRRVAVSWIEDLSSDELVDYLPQLVQAFLYFFPDCEVRRVAVSWIQDLSSDELVDYLPQLVQALKHETYEASPLARLLLERALTSPRVAHHLYWLLTQALPGPSPQVS
ncbi:Phosphatidylinositol 4-phosphate 3-kinase C2 domain-containing subunit alpha [Homalodisca vitripennis]|nr:Phosphatidylinositol 4-phosphate 3-kinase C2 domain-containing subunit alpha [Homalodisca vitripennis]